jgi:ABC-2 type transport system ATP-binding protein
MHAIEITGLTKRYDSHLALNGVSLAVPAGSVYALLGPNGAGKTTLLHILMGLRTSDAGIVKILGKERSTLTLVDRAAIGYASENQRLPEWMRLGFLEDYLAPLYPAWDQALAAELRSRFRLRRDQRIKTMSRGENMKAALLCTLAPRPSLLVMDEPFTGIDVAAKDDIVRAILSTAGEQGMTVLISTHDIAELETAADWIGFLDRGVLRLSRSVDELREEFRPRLATPSLREIFIALANEPAAELEVVL